MVTFKDIALVLVLGLICMTSCRTYKDGEIYQNLEGQDLEVGAIEDDEMAIEIAYIGAIGHSYIFECAMTNLSDETIVIDKRQFSMTINGAKIQYPIYEDDVVSELNKTKKTLKNRRKADTALGILGIGLNVLLTASTGTSVGEAVLTNAEPLVYIMDDRRWYKRNIESVEDEIEYVRSAQYNNQLILPKKTVVRDLLFPTTKVDGDVDISVFYNGESYVITFPKETFR